MTDEQLLIIMRFCERYGLEAIIRNQRAAGQSPTRILIDQALFNMTFSSFVEQGRNGKTGLKVFGLEVWTSNYLDGADVLVETLRAPTAEEVQLLLNEQLLHPGRVDLNLSYPFKPRRNGNS